MAEQNEIRISSTVTPVQDIEQTAGGQSYDIQELDKVAGKSFGGKYDTLTAYTSGDIARYTEAIVAENSATDGLDASGWQEGAGGPTAGTLPTTVYAIAVEYTATLGTVATVSVGVNNATGEIRLANLSLGEGIVIPIAGGLTLANVLIGASAYTDGTHEATINLLVMGV